MRRAPDWLLALLLLVGAFLWQRTAFPAWMVDLFHLQYAAYEFRVGETEWMYTTDDHFGQWLEHRAPVARALQAEGDPNADYYAPFLPAVLSPLAAAPAPTWRDVLFVINVGLVFGLAYLCLRASEAKPSLRNYLWALVLVLMTYPMARATLLGQQLPLLAVLTWVGLLSMRGKRQIAGGIVLGVVTAIKLFPAAFIALPWVTGKRQAVVAWMATTAAIFGVSLLTLGLHLHQLWWAALHDIGSVVYPFFGNQSPTGWYARMVMRYGLLDTNFPPPLEILLVRWAGFILFGGMSAFLLWKLRARRDDTLFMPRAGLILSATILILPVAWEHYWLFVLPTLGWAICDVWLRGDRRFWELWLAAATFFFTMKLTHFYGDSMFGEIMSGSQTLGMLLLWIWFVRRAWLLMANRRTEPARELRATAA